MVVLLLRLNNQYRREAEELEEDVPAAAAAPMLRRHVVLVFVDRIDMAMARAIQYGRTHTTAELRAVHFALDEEVAELLAAEWQRLGLHAGPARDRGVPRPAADEGGGRARWPGSWRTARPR